MIQRLIHGWGINDAVYVTKRCLIYRCWQDMIKRCHCPIQYPTYVGCWVDERWQRFMTFREWYLEQTPNLGEQLDKDLLGNGKLYSPETCYFVPGWLNMLFCNAGSIRGEWPQGVTYDKVNRKFQAQIKRKGKIIFLGRFKTPEEASAAYLKAKAVYIEELLAKFPQPLRLVAAIRRKMVELIQQETISHTLVVSK